MAIYHNAQLLSSKKYGEILIRPCPRAMKTIGVYEDMIEIIVPVKDCGISLEDAEKDIEHHLFCKSKKREREGISPAGPDFKLDYPIFKLAVRLSDTDKMQSRKEGDKWVVLCPSDSDFNSLLVQERFFDHLHNVLYKATNDYLDIRGKEIADIIGTSIPTLTASTQMEYCNLGENEGHPAEKEARNTSYDEDSHNRIVNDIIKINPKLMCYPAEYIDSVIIHEFIHNYFFDHGEDFQSSTDYYCEKILGKTERQISEKYEQWNLAMFAEKPLYKVIATPRPSFVRVNGKILRRVDKTHTPPQRVYFNFDTD